MTIDYIGAKKLLDNAFAKVEGNLFQGLAPEVEEPIRKACDTLFLSNTQAYREVLLGCVLARIQDKGINIRQPYADQGPNAFSGRSLDERVVNPFLKDKQIPSSRGPYLSVFRRSIQFDTNTRSGLRDKSSYDAFLAVISQLELISDYSELLNILHFVLYKFLKLREESTIQLSRVQRLSLEQYDSIIAGLLSTPSGGRFPVLLVVATLSAIKEFFKQDWIISWQGINVADAASGAIGDITVMAASEILMAVEVTERPLDKSRVITTFNTKIARAGIVDYLFFVKSEAPAEARQQAHQYFAQGHEINFLEIKNWIIVSLATMGTKGRAIFNRVLIELLDKPEIPKTLRVKWNELLARITMGEN